MTAVHINTSSVQCMSVIFTRTGIRVGLPGIHVQVTQFACIPMTAVHINTSSVQV